MFFLYFFFQCIILPANSDIYFDETLLRLHGKNVEFGNAILALTKYSRRGNSSLEFHFRIDSQDAWIFQPPLKENVVNAVDFWIGSPRCDNVLAHIFESNGYKVLNAALAIRAIEIKSLQRENSLYPYYGAILGLTKFLLFSDKFLF